MKVSIVGFRNLLAGSTTLLKRQSKASKPTWFPRLLSALHDSFTSSEASGGCSRPFVSWCRNCEKCLLLLAVCWLTHGCVSLNGSFACVLKRAWPKCPDFSSRFLPRN